MGKDHNDEPIELDQYRPDYPYLEAYKRGFRDGEENGPATFDQKVEVCAAHVKGVEFGKKEVLADIAKMKCWCDSSVFSPCFRCRILLKWKYQEGKDENEESKV